MALLLNNNWMLENGIVNLGTKRKFEENKIKENIESQNQQYVIIDKWPILKTFRVDWILRRKEASFS